MSKDSGGSEAVRLYRRGMKMEVIAQVLGITMKDVRGELAGEATREAMSRNKAIRPAHIKHARWTQDWWDEQQMAFENAMRDAGFRAIW